jgi:hypothetical protein
MTDEVLNRDDVAELRKRWEIEEHARRIWRAKVSEHRELGEQVVAAKKNYDSAAENVRAFLDSKRSDLFLDAAYDE